MIGPRIYTVGHSNHPIDYFLQLLTTNAINCLVDVRTVPASKYNPQYNQIPLSNYLRHHNISYLHFAEEFGARHTDPDLLDNDGKVDFDKVRKSWIFKNGIERLRQGIDKGFTIALMCSEAEPLECHRFSMISFSLSREEFEVVHILKDNGIKKNLELEKELLAKYNKKLPKPDIFQQEVTLEDQLRVAYKLCNKEIAFSPDVRQTEESQW